MCLPGGSDGLEGAPGLDLDQGVLLRAVGGEGEVVEVEKAPVPQAPAPYT